MEQNINLGILLVVVLLEIILYFILSISVIPKVLRAKCGFRESADRGLRKYRYPSGRSVVYEPHPSIRKYVTNYVLFTNNGYKYLKCKLDEEISRLKYSVIMFNNRNRVIDVLEVDERNFSEFETAELQLHQDTSYILLKLNEVNGEPIKHDQTLKVSFWLLPVYSILTGVLSFVEMMFIKDVLGLYDRFWIKLGLVKNVTYIYMVAPAIVIGAAAGLITFLNHRAKGIGWTK